MRMSQQILTERLSLRRPRRSDADALAGLMNDWEVVRWLVQAPYPYTRTHAVEWISQNLQNLASGREFQFVVCRQSDDEVIGHAGLRLDDDRKGGELGYWLARDVWGAGYASEAAATIISFGFGDLQLEKIWATCLPDNGPSLRVLSKMGFNQVGSLKQKFEPIGQTVDCPVLVLCRQDVSDRRNSG